MSIRDDCEHFPCHHKMDDCDLCYCPLYPCKDKRTGGKWLVGKDNGSKRIWDCTECCLFHNKIMVDKIREYMVWLIEEWWKQI